MNKPTQDYGIPVLTEVIVTPPRVPPVSPSVPAFTPMFSPAATTIPEVEDLADIPVLQVEIEVPLTPVEHTPINGWLDEEWTRMEQKISERVLTQLLSRIDTVLEERLQEVLGNSLQRAVDEIRQGLHQTLGEVVSDAVAQEINHLHFSKKIKIA